MTARALLVAPLVMWSAAALARPAPKPIVKSYDSLAPIIARILHARPRVIGFGEYHQTKDGPKARSAISRFTGEMLDAFKAGASDLVVETWITKGDCGATEKKVVKEVETTTQRPEATEDEVVTLIKRAKTDGLQPHILELSCDEYRAIEPKDGEVDYEKLLGVITEKLRRAIIFALAMQAGGPPRTVLVYGGALHNDLRPEAALSAYSFGPAIDRAVQGRYFEVDLYVPEYIEGDREITSQPWYPRYLAAARPGRPTLIERGPRSYIIVFARQAPLARPPDGGAE